MAGDPQKGHGSNRSPGIYNLLENRNMLTNGYATAEVALSQRLELPQCNALLVYWKPQTTPLR